MAKKPVEIEVEKDGDIMSPPSTDENLSTIASENEALNEALTDKAVQEAIAEEFKESLKAEQEAKPFLYAIFLQNWIESIEMSPGMSMRCLNSWAKDKIVTSQEDIERLRKSGAPIKVLVEYVDGSAEGTG